MTLALLYNIAQDGETRPTVMIIGRITTTGLFMLQLNTYVLFVTATSLSPLPTYPYRELQLP